MVLVASIMSIRWIGRLVAPFMSICWRGRLVGFSRHSFGG